ncbi:hypothetical protein L6452_34626 [Arctium lappa]|uniref:Uncharacterized protein n=1 Tax=Arctium lappa TaxID=4217 RepID=A0ACB8YJ90_ARCLA|nr:hypothetical protein L6452_34626 [Arctium lappa]
MSNQMSIFSKKFSDFSRKSCEEKKTVELKCIKLYQRISDFEKRKDAEKDFEEERNIFETEIKKLTKKIYELSESALKDQKAKSEFKEMIDLFIKERDSYSSKIKKIEDIFSKVVVTEQTTPESKIHTPRNSSVGSNKPASSSHQKTVSSKRSGAHRRRRYKEEKLVWKVKPIDEEKNDEKKEEKKGKKEEKKSNKSFVHASNVKKNKVLKGKPDFSYSRIQLIRTATHKHGPKYQWVPKPKDDSVLQSSQVKAGCYTHNLSEFAKLQMNIFIGSADNQRLNVKRSVIFVLLLKEITTASSISTAWRVSTANRVTTASMLVLLMIRRCC